MRNATDRAHISGGRTTWEDVPCKFAFMDSIKSEALYGAQESKGSLIIPLYIDIPEGGKLLENYRVILISPRHKRIDQPMLIDSIKWARNHQYLVLTIPNVT